MAADLDLALSVTLIITVTVTIELFTIEVAKPVYTSRMSSASVENRRCNDEEQPLLRLRRKPGFPSLNLEHWYSYPLQGERWTMQNPREKTGRFLSSKTGHYSVLILVSLDLLAMIADFILQLFKCEQGKIGADWDLALDILGSVSLVFSCLFMLELIASVWAFGWDYFNSWFHCFDAFIVVAGFITDVVLRGIVEEVASLIVVMRLWRVIKIIEELSLGAQEQGEEMELKMNELRNDNDLLKKEVSRLRRTLDKAGVHNESYSTLPTEES
ncbi:Fc.00g084790.m01.CDS01 [Cosmosporella sp. VM-42]